MSLTLLQVMEEVGSRQTGRIASYVNDGLKELGGLIPNNVQRTKIGIKAGTRLYSLPTNVQKIRGVFQKYDNNNDKYIRIGRIKELDILQKENTQTILVAGDFFLV